MESKDLKLDTTLKIERQKFQMTKKGFEEIAKAITDLKDVEKQEVNELNGDDTIIIKAKKGEKGDDGHTPTKTELVTLIKPLIPKPIKGDNGYTPKKNKDYFDGKDYILTEKDKKEIAKSINVPIVEKLIEKTEKVVEKPIVKEVAKYESAETIVSKLGTVKRAWLPIDAVENLRSELSRTHGGGGGGVNSLSHLIDVDLSGLLQDSNGRYILGSGSGSGSDFETINISGTQNSVNTSFTLATIPNATAPFFLFLNGQKQVVGIDYTLSGGTVTFISYTPTSTDIIEAFGGDASVSDSSFSLSYADSYFDDGAVLSLAGTALRNSDTLYGLLDNYTNEEVTFTKVNGYTDADIDGVILRKKGSEYFKRVLPDNVIDVQIFGAVADPAVNNTTAIRNAIASAAAFDINNVRVSGGTYIVDGGTEIALRDNINLIIDASATLQQIPTTAGVYSIVSVRNASNVTITGGGKIVGDLAGHLGVTGEYGMGITIDQSSNVTVKDIHISQCWGDGMYIGGGTTASTCSNIILENIVSDGNRRQGFSVTNVSGLKASNCRGINTSGTAPQAGIDLEPNSDQTIENCQFIDCEFSGNTGSGINGYQAYANSYIKNVSFINPICNNNTYNGIDISTITTDSIIGMTIVNMQAGGNVHRGMSFEHVTDLNITGGKLLENGVLGNYLGTLKRAVIDGLTIIDTNPSSVGFGILGANQDVTIQNCTVSVANYAVNAVISSSNTNFKLLNNTFTSTATTGLFLNNFTDSLFSGNILRDCGGYGFRFNNSNKNNIYNNKIVGAGAGTTNVYHALYFEGTCSYNNIQGNTVETGVSSNQIKYCIALLSGTASNCAINNDFLNANPLNGTFSDAGTDNTLVDNRYRLYGTTANRPTSPPSNYIYYDTTLDSFVRYFGSGWANVGLVRNSGAAHTNLDGVNLSGTLTEGSITKQVVSSGTGYPVASGEVWTYNAYDYGRTYSLFKAAGLSSLYIQYYDSAGVGLGWNLAIPGGATTSSVGTLRFATTAEINAGSSDFIGVNALQLEGSKYLNQSGSKTYATVTGTDTYTATITPAITSYATGQTVFLKFTNANTGASTINLNSIGAKAITKNGTTALAAGDIVALGMYTLVYDGTRFIISGSIATAGVTSVATDSTLTGGAITSTGTLGINLATANIFTAVQSVNKAGIASTSTDGYILQNATAATSGATLQYSPRLRWTGSAWNTTSLAAETNSFIEEVRVATGNPTTATWALQSSIAGGAYTDRLTVSGTGTVSIGGALGVTGTIFGNNYSNSSTSNNALIALATTGTTISRNVADANDALIVNQINASSTGNIANFKFAGTAVAMITTGGRLGLGSSTAPTAQFQMSGGNTTTTAFGTSGMAISQVAGTYSSSTSTGTIATTGINSIGIPTLTATSSTTLTTAASVYIGGEPIASTNVTITTPISLHVAGTNQQLRLSYDATNYATFAVTSGGVLNITPSSANVNFVNSNFAAGNASSNFWVGAFTGVTGSSSSTYTFGGASTTRFRMGMRGGTNANNLLANESYAGLVIGTQAATIAATGTHGLFAQQVIKALTVTTGAGGALTNTATLYIEAAATSTGATGDDYSVWIDAGSTRLDGRVLKAKGADVASANDLTLGSDGNTFGITGTTTINAITISKWTAGSEINLIFAGALTLKHNTAGSAGTAKIFLAGSVDLTTAANTVIKLVYDGTQWQEVSRKIA